MHLRCIKPKGTKKRILSKQPTETIEIEVVLPRDTIEAPTTTTNTENQPQSPTTPTTTANMSALSNSMNQLNDLRSYSRHWLGEFIDLYQAEECLWQPKHPDYSNHSVRNKAYDKLVEKLKEVEPNPDRAMVVRKINSLRSAFRREFRKSNSKANYETRLWYYDKLLFIAEQNPKRLSSPMDVKPPKRSLPIGFDDEDSMDYTDDQQMDTSGGTNGAAAQTDPIQSVEGGVATDVGLVKEEGRTGGGGGGSGAHTQDDLHHHHTQLQQQQQQATAAAVAVQQAQPQHTTAVKVLEITSLDSNSQREIQQAVNTFEHQQQQMHQQLQQQTGQTHIHQQVPTIQISREHLQPLFGSSTYSATTGTSHRNDDEYDAIGINVASKLRVMNPTQRIIAEKLISDVLFNGQLDNLSINSTLTQ